MRTVFEWNKQIENAAVRAARLGYCAHISYSNTKTVNTPSFSTAPLITCGHCAQCYKKCYYERLCERFPGVTMNAADNTLTAQEQPEIIEQAVIDATRNARFFRWYVGGDIPSYEFFDIMVNIARKRKTTRFLTFTKKPELVNKWLENNGGKFPNNFIVVLSAWLEYQPVNPYNLPVAQFVPRGMNIPRGARECSGNCGECQDRRRGCWYLKNGQTVAFHEH